MTQHDHQITRDQTNFQAAHIYPLNHWQELRRFVEGEEYDPKHLFRLTNDLWDAWPYAASGRPTEAALYRFHFGHLHSFLKPYVKWYCYQRLLGGRSLSAYAAAQPYYLKSADAYLCAHEIKALEGLADPLVFADLWDSLIQPCDESQGPRPVRAIKTQLSTRAFWEHLRAHFGIPEVIPPYAPHVNRKPVEFAADSHQIIPLPVIRQLVNRLALHRDGLEVLNRYHHHRLCVLILVLCLGRRIGEILGTPRGQGPEGPLHTYPAKDHPNEEALWFQFHPGKQGPRDLVYISPEWRDVVSHCVRTLCAYGNEIRSFASPSEQHLLILLSAWNWTAGSKAATMPASRQGNDLAVFQEDDQTTKERIWLTERHAHALRQADFCNWINGWRSSKGQLPGILERWQITEDGRANGAIYYLRTHQARHTRQSALAKDPRVSFLTKQRDLNHRHQEMQFAYQHTLREQQQTLLEKARAGALFGLASNWLTDLLSTKPAGQQADEERSSSFSPGHPILLDARWRALVARSPYFLQFNRVPCGYCTLPQGPEGCLEYLNCLEATDEGCQWFVTDPENEELLSEIGERVIQHQRSFQESARMGREVQAQKYATLARRAERVQGEVLKLSSQDLRERLRARKQELESEQSCRNE